MTEREAQQSQEAQVVQAAQAALTAQQFIPLAEAARQTGVPLSTLAYAVRKGRLPALQVQPRRWSVRLNAVKLYLSQDEAYAAHEKQIEDILVADGLLAPRTKPRPRMREITPVKLGGEPILISLREGRR